MNRRDAAMAHYPWKPVSDEVLTALEYGAVAAEQAKTAARAVDAAWSALHADRAAMLGAFQAWSQHARERVDDVPSLGEIVRQRCRTPADVAGSLRGAAEAARSAS